MPEEPKIAYLRQISELSHSGGTLLDHLIGTRAVLSRWGERPAVCDAGLFHSVYGTETFLESAIPISLRHTVIELIGEEAERIAYLFGAMDVESFFAALRDGAPHALKSRFTGEVQPSSPTTFVDLCHIMAANAVEQLPRLPEAMRYPRKQDYLRLTNFLSSPARADVNALYWDDE